MCGCKKLIIQIDLSEEESQMYDKLCEDKHILHIFMFQVESKIRSQIYINYKSYRHLLDNGKDLY